MDKLLEYFIEEPEKEFHVRQLAKLTRKSPTTISKYLAKFKKDELLNSRRKLNHLLYRAHTESIAFRDLKLSHNIKQLRQSGLLLYLIEEFNSPEAIILFGSYRKAEDTAQSDIDIMIVSPSQKQLQLLKYEKLLNRKIQLFVYAKAEIERMKIKNKELLNNLVNGIVLRGFWELFK
ncbi:nucleotidyltransferase domain-containing protein [Candidatus Woesearchaeota archaeon]|nr:nucleotidyltransferase domain-containing protein [Candidatus Woesearchaeota archaeon]